MNPITPQSFLGGPAYHAPATPPSRTQEPRVAYVSQAEPRLSVRADGFIHLNAEAARLLPAGDGTIDLRAPIRERDNWHLDCRPGGHYRRLPVGMSGGIRFKAAPRTHLILGACATVLHFRLQHVGHGLFKLYTETVNK